MTGEGNRRVHSERTISSSTMYKESTSGGAHKVWSRSSSDDSLNRTLQNITKRTSSIAALPAWGRRSTLKRVRSENRQLKLAKVAETTPLAFAEAADWSRLTNTKDDHRGSFVELLCFFLLGRLWYCDALANALSSRHQIWAGKIYFTSSCCENYMAQPMYVGATVYLPFTFSNC